MDPNRESEERREGPNAGPRIPLRGLAVWLLLLALFITMFSVFSQNQEKHEKIPFSPNFVSYLEAVPAGAAKLMSVASPLVMLNR